MSQSFLLSLCINIHSDEVLLNILKRYICIFLDIKIRMKEKNLFKNSGSIKFSVIHFRGRGHITPGIN